MLNQNPGALAGMGNLGHQVAADTQLRAAQNAPKEVGLIQRMDNLRAAIDHSHARLQALAARIGGNSSEDSPTVPPPPAGIPANLATCEMRIQQILELITQFENAF